MTLCSIIIPTYNHARYVAHAIESGLAQTAESVEIIVVDDGSTDNTREVMRPYLDRVKYIYQTNQGLSAARNTGIRAANGSYLQFLDADDWIDPLKIELQSQYLDLHPQAGLVYCAWHFIEETSGKSLDEAHPHTDGEVLRLLLLRQFYFPPGAALVRRACVDAVGWFDTSLRAAEDMDYWVRAAHAGYRFGYLDQALFFYRVVTGSMSKNLANQSRNEFARLEKFFSLPNLTPQTVELKNIAFAVIHYEYCAKYINAGEIEQAHLHLREAVRLSPRRAEDSETLLEWLAGFALDPSVAKPASFLRAFFHNLPEELSDLAPLYPAAIGRYHTAACFHAYRSKNFKSLRAHLLPAVIRSPRVLLNRGFLRLALESVKELFK
jgi:glycosyltransferase involved in cell wall biosynthesis